MITFLLLFTADFSQKYLKFFVILTDLLGKYIG